MFLRNRWLKFFQLDLFVLKGANKPCQSKVDSSNSFYARHNNLILVLKWNRTLTKNVSYSNLQCLPFFLMKMVI